MFESFKEDRTQKLGYPIETGIRFFLRSMGVRETNLVPSIPGPIRAGSVFGKAEHVNARSSRCFRVRVNNSPWTKNAHGQLTSSDSRDTETRGTNLTALDSSGTQVIILVQSEVALLRARSSKIWCDMHIWQGSEKVKSFLNWPILISKFLSISVITDQN